MVQTHFSGATAQDPRWARIVARDPAANGLFWYSVASTGIYCRPSCASRTANPANVTIHDSIMSARATGARACLRCRPDDAGVPHAAAILAACRAIKASEDEPALATLAAAAGYSPGHFHRLFKATTGLTPKGYAIAWRAERLRAALSTADRVVDAVYDAGFATSSRFYERSSAMLGMTPARYRRGGAAETLRFAVGRCSLGSILVASSNRGVAAILFGNDAEALVHDLEDRFPAATLVGADPAYEAIVARVVAMVEAPGSAAGIDLPLDIRGTAFQQRVWQALVAVPAGTTVSYGDIAQAIGHPRAVRAVAGACAANAHAVAIPCHRVVRRDGDPSGYRWGIDRKAALIAREGAGMPAAADPISAPPGAPAGPR